MPTPKVALDSDPVYSTPTYEGSTFAPQCDPDDLKSWWMRPIRPVDLASPNKLLSYLPFKVLVTENTLDPKTRRGTITFDLVRVAMKGLTLNVPNQWNDGWPDIPSTAQFAGPGEYGFLFLSEKWAANNKVIQYAEGGGKWPPGGGTLLNAMLDEIMTDEGLRSKLLDFIEMLTQNKNSNG